MVKRLIQLTTWAAGSLVLSVLFLMVTSAQAESPIRINLVGSKTTYLPGEPIQMQITVFNDSGGDAITRDGYLNQDFHLMLTFTDPDGNPIRSIYAPGGAEPGPAIKCGTSDCALVEVVPFDGFSTLEINSILDYYNITQYGNYTAQIISSLETFSLSEVDPLTGALLSRLDDPGREFSDPLVSNKISFEIAPLEPIVETYIRVVVKEHKIGGGSSPNVVSTLLDGTPVRLYRRSELSVYEPANWKTYSVIWDNVDPFRSGFTVGGVVNFENIEQDDYVLIGRDSPSQDYKHMGSPIGADDTDWASFIEKHLMVMEKYNGPRVSGKTTRLKGSDLLITEPEYIEWGSTQELYPFVFETIGDWTVTTSVSPPEGFVADSESLSADVDNELEAVQFMITDVGSRWEETEVQYKIKHKGKSKVIKSKIGVKLSEKFAEEKGLGVYGHTESPGPFKGGRKLGHQ
jgi:hypothetical protein